MPEVTAIDAYVRDQARRLRDKDTPPKTQDEWDARRKLLVRNMLNSAGPMPTTPEPLDPKILGTLERDGYRIEKLVFQSRPDVLVTATAYVPAIAKDKKVPSVLVVHGHWAWARRDPTVQARCLGLVKLGFFVLAVDAFGAGERHPKPARGTYHGALMGATLWPSGHSLLGMQLYDNRRAVDYILSRPEADGKLGVTGASGGGNQTMYAGALDDRFHAVVPVCSVGSYQAYVNAACCVCEVLPNALTYTDEGDVLGLVAPRSLMVINATRDSFNFSPEQASISVGRAKEIFGLYGKAANVRHVIIESGHDYNQKMREEMYGWMTRHLKGEGDGSAIPEPKHQVEKVEDLACFPNPDDRPKSFSFPPVFAAKASKLPIEAIQKLKPDHPQMWEATGENLRRQLLRLFGPMPIADKPAVKATTTKDGVFKEHLEITVDAGLTISATVEAPLEMDEPKPRPLAILVSLDGKEKARSHAIADPLFQTRNLVTVELRATGSAKSKWGPVSGSTDHTPAEHGIWLGRPLLGQWVADLENLLNALREEGYDLARNVIVGIGGGALVAMSAVGLFPGNKSVVVMIDPMTTYVTDKPYASGTSMGNLVPGILNVGDIPHLAGLCAPQPLYILGGSSPDGRKLKQDELEAAFAFTSAVYQANKLEGRPVIQAEPDWKNVKL